MIEQIQPRDLPQWVARVTQATTPLLLDVREPAECRVASVQAGGTELLQWPMHTVPARLPELDRGRPIAVLCHHGGRSMQVALFLEQRGFDRLANVAGGIDAWALQLDPSLPRY
ncbi:MAG TPA: rhodanese-like domain-containing protein [Ottowia sp.]|uniref:rhodanese-like domain-containing protein n=1 Tax=Ottowia sp. TaxID=1898956 RepID=UPI002BD2A481|nr:rhodanese-like domain-containing protein [Ottowia sp.]HMN21623.1 rhodanese-like domain-containing protein [Ottowia sp.]